MPRLLIVEDDPGLRQMLSWELEELDYEVTATASCSEAYSVSENGSFELALLDYNLPDGVGTSLLSHLQQRHPGLQVVLYSGRDLTGVATEVVGRGKCLCISKPVKIRALHALFNRLMVERTRETLE